MRALAELFIVHLKPPQRSVELISIRVQIAKKANDIPLTPN